MSSGVDAWTVDEVCAWLKRNGIGQLASTFKSHEIDGEVLLTMSEHDLQANPLNVTKFGVVRKLALKIQQLKTAPPVEILPKFVENTPPPKFVENWQKVVENGEKNGERSSSESAATVEILSDNSVDSSSSNTPVVDETINLTTEDGIDENGNVEKKVNGEEEEVGSDGEVSNEEYGSVVQEESSNSSIENYSVDSNDEAEETPSEGANERKKTRVETAPNESERTRTNSEAKVDEKMVLIKTYEEKYSNYIWRYQSPNSAISSADVGRPSEGFTPVVISPNKFYFLSNFLYTQALKLMHLMEVYDGTKKTFPSDVVIYESMPCAAFYEHEKGWYRAMVKKIIDQSSVQIYFIDWGNEAIVDVKKLKPLLMEFGRFPPLALECRIDGVPDELSDSSVLSFQDEMNSLQLCGKIVVTSIGTDVVNVRLLSKNDVDIGKKYEAPAFKSVPCSGTAPHSLSTILQCCITAVNKPEPQTQISKEEVGGDSLVETLNFASANEKQAKELEAMKCKQEKRRQGLYACDMEAFLDGAPLDDDSSISSGKEEEEEKVKAQAAAAVAAALLATASETTTIEGVQYLLAYPQQSPPPNGVFSVEIVKVHSVRELYVRTEKNKAVLRAMSDDFDEYYGGGGESTLSVSDKLIRFGTPCAFYAKRERRWFRGRIGQVASRDEYVPITLIDYGRYETVDRQSMAKNVKMLRVGVNFRREPQIYACKLDELCDPPVAEVETKLVKELLVCDEEATVSCKFVERKKEPYRIRLRLSVASDDFVQDFQQAMNVRGIHREAVEQRHQQVSVKQ